MESTTHDRSLCSDIMMEILTRSSLETIGCCRILSKECNNLTYEQTFKNLLGQRTNTTSGIFLQSLYKCKYSSMLLPLNNYEPLPGISLEFLPRYAKIEASTRQGIMLFRDDESPRVPQFYVCKPTTRQCQRIPNPKTRYQTKAIGMIVVRTKPLHYKVVRLSEPSHCINFKKQPCQYTLRRELFDSQTFQWKQLPQVSLPLESYFSPWNGSVLASGTLHWLTSRDTIVAFQGNNESWTLFSVPPHLEKHDYKAFKLVEYGGKLGFVYMRGGGSFMEVWVMECYEQRTWYKTHSFDLEFFTKHNPYSTLVGYYVPGIVVMTSFYRLFLINPKDARSVMMELNYNFSINDGPFQFESDFEITDLPSSGDQFGRKISRPKTKEKKCIDLQEIKTEQDSSFCLSPIFVFLFLLFSLFLALFSFDI